MPIYEYRCESCGHTLDALQKVSDEPLKECPSCDRAALKRLISAPAFRLKGSGWYETDFKSEKDKKRNLAESAGAESGDGKKDADKAKPADDKAKPKTEDKPKPKSDSKSEPKPKSAKGSGSEAA